MGKKKQSLVAPHTTTFSTVRQYFFSLITFHSLHPSAWGSETICCLAGAKANSTYNDAS